MVWASHSKICAKCRKGCPNGDLPKNSPSQTRPSFGWLPVTNFQPHLWGKGSVPTGGGLGVRDCLRTLQHTHRTIMATPVGTQLEGHPTSNQSKSQSLQPQIPWLITIASLEYIRISHYSIIISHFETNRDYHSHSTSITKSSRWQPSRASSAAAVRRIAALSAAWAQPQQLTGLFVCLEGCFWLFLSIRTNSWCSWSYDKKLTYYVTLCDDVHQVDS